MTNASKLYQCGFTLIELLTVIVIIGILSAVATPALLSLGSDARIATLQSFKNTLSSTAQMVRTKVKVSNTACTNGPSSSYNIGNAPSSMLMQQRLAVTT